MCPIIYDYQQVSNIGHFLEMHDHLIFLCN